ncbi:MAG: hypothetical protein LBM93_14880 [Oscillospiraceae bacterium]|jgi:hypothetical protein|nr:hypothetical protein [Oscillospiraceae bacterium]
MAEKGKSLLTMTAAWLIIKEILNFIFALIGGGSIWGILNILVAAVICFALFYCPYWIKYVVALFLVVQMLRGVIPNISDIIGMGGIYLLEGIVDIIFAFLICTSEDVKKYYDEKSV